jgi:Pyruvate/2-oxoacid:ferredoxin oxidoreductase gamma subunit
MLPVFPLGVKKDVPAEPWPAWKSPRFDPDELAAIVGAERDRGVRTAAAFPTTPWGKDIAVKLAGAGGDGAQTAGVLLARIAIEQGFDATHIPSYGPESRGGTSYADVRIAEREVLSPAAPRPHVLVAFNAPSLAKFGPAVPPGGIVLFDRSTVASPPTLDPGVRPIGVPFTAIASEVGQTMFKNTVALGAFQEATALFPKEAFLAGMRQALREKPALVRLNEEAFSRGAQAIRDRKLADS